MSGKESPSTLRSSLINCVSVFSAKDGAEEGTTAEMDSFFSFLDAMGSGRPLPSTEFVSTFMQFCSAAPFLKEYLR